MSEFESLTKAQRELCVRAGVIRKAAKRCGLTPGNLSRTFSGSIKTPNPRAVRALKQEIAKAIREEQRNLASFQDRWAAKLTAPAAKVTDTDPEPEAAVA